MNSIHTTVPALGDTPITLSRCGYTGEDGFEISVHEDEATKFFDALINTSEGAVLPIGLGARDSLRLEAGLCLYGHDLNEDITPIEASLLWTIGKKKKKQGGYLGAEHVIAMKKAGPKQKRVGFIFEKGPSAREGAKLEANGEVIGTVTSGTFSPCLKHAIGMAYVKTEYSKVGTEIKMAGKKFVGQVAKMPVVPARYFK
jgi:aminomethyltransferase